MKTVDEQVELAERLGVVLRLLRDAGAEDVAARVSVEAGEALYHGLVHNMQDAAARWRTEQSRGGSRERRGDGPSAGVSGSGGVAEGHAAGTCHL